jgi:hypothetical protein
MGDIPYVDNNELEMQDNSNKLKQFKLESCGRLATALTGRRP